MSITFWALIALTVLIAYLFGRVKGEVLITKYKVKSERLYEILSEERKRHVACMQRTEPYHLKVFLDKDIEQINPNLEKISSKKATKYNNRRKK